jgi:hypothetical protein
MAGRPFKEFHEYLTDGGKSHVDHASYAVCPSSAFLSYTVEAKSALDLCIRHFPKNTNGHYNKAAKDSLEHLVSALLPSIMGHFETYQRYLFAGVFDRSVHLEKFDVTNFFKRLEKNTNCSIDLTRLAAHRGFGAKSIGLLLADSINGWHSPELVNLHFDAFGLQRQLFGNDEIRRLKVLWQLRHSLVHTGGTLTLPDAQKVSELSNFGDKNIVFEKNFIFEVARKIHPLVQSASGNISVAFLARLNSATTKSVKKELEDFFNVSSSVPAWLS